MDKPASLHIPVSASLKSSARVAVKKLGYSTIQEYIRVHLTKLVTEQQVPKVEKPNALIEEDDDGWRL